MGALRRFSTTVSPWSYLVVVAAVAAIVVLAVAATTNSDAPKSERLALRAAFAGQAYSVHAHVEYEDCSERGEYAPKGPEQGVGCFIVGAGAGFRELAGVPGQDGAVWFSRRGTDDEQKDDTEAPADGVVGGRRVAIAPLPKDGNLPRELDADLVRISATWAADRRDRLVSPDALFVVDTSIAANESDLDDRRAALSEMLPGWDIDPISEAAARPPNLDDYEVVIVDFKVGPEALDGALVTTSRGVVSWSFNQWEDWAVDSLPINVRRDEDVAVVVADPKADLVEGVFGALPPADPERLAGARRWLFAGWLFVVLFSIAAAVVLVGFTIESKTLVEEAKAVEQTGKPSIREVLAPTLYDDLTFEGNRYLGWNNAFIACAGIVVSVATLVWLAAVRVTGLEPSYVGWSSWLGGLAWVTVGLFLALIGRVFFGTRHLQRFKEVFSHGNGILPDRWPQIDRSQTADIGICFSGGGVRSAAYALGAIQVFQEEAAIWDRVKHMSAVSGGSYMAAAYAIARQKGADHPYRVGSPEERHLRNNTNYLAPTLIDKLRAVAEWFSGFVVNVLVILSLLWIAAGVAALVAKSAAAFPQLAFLSGGRSRDLLAWDVWDLPGDEAVILSLVAVVLVGVFSATRRNGETRDLSRRIAELFAWVAMALAILLILVPGASRLWGNILDLADSVPALSATLGSIAVVGWIFATVKTLVSQHPGKVAGLIAGLAPPLLSVAFVTWAGWRQVRMTASEYLLGLLIAVVVLVLLGFLLPTMRVSLHPFYRRRLSDAYAWVPNADNKETARQDAGGETQKKGDPDLSLDALTHSPTLIIAAAANYGPSPVTPPGRSALPFAFSSEAVGLETEGSASPSKPAPWLVRTRDVSALFEQENGTKLRVMDAVAISGAAVSPSMGKRTVGLYRALLAVLNIRLGVWMPNPLLRHLWAADFGTPPALPPTRRDFAGPPRQLPWFAKEVFGQHEPMQHFVYVTDGGHYDNLGLLTLLRKRCRTIVCFDAGGEDMQSFTSIGQAMMLAESELGVRIRFSPNPDLWPPVAEDSPDPVRRKVWPGKKGDTLPEVPSDHTTAVVEYPGAEPDGLLIYCKTAVTVDSAWSVKDYRIRHPSFPNISTLRQLYDDERFEAYRELGVEAAQGAVRTLEEHESSGRPADQITKSGAGTHVPPSAPGRNSACLGGRS